LREIARWPLESYWHTPQGRSAGGGSRTWMSSTSRWIPPTPDEFARGARIHRSQRRRHQPLSSSSSVSTTNAGCRLRRVGPA